MSATTVSEAIRIATESGIYKDPVVKEISSIESEIEKKKKEITDLEAKLYVIQKNRPEVAIKWRESINWCLTVDSHSPKYFLKTTAGVYNCVAYKHKVEIDAQMKSKVGSTLSLMFRQKLIGRYEHVNGNHYYGLLEFFEKDCTTIKKKYAKDLDQLI